MEGDVGCLEKPTPTGPIRQGGWGPKQRHDDDDRIGALQATVKNQKGTLGTDSE